MAAHNATYAAPLTKLRVDGIATDQSIDDALTAAVAEVALAVGKIVTRSAPVVLNKQGLALVGTNATNTGLHAAAAMPTGPLLVLGSTTDTTRSALRVDHLTLMGARGPAAAIGHLKDSILDRLWITGAAGSGVKSGHGGRPSWNLECIGVTSYDNAVDGVDGSANAMNWSLRACNVVGNGRYGINAPKKSLIDRCTFDGNAVADLNIEGQDDVTVTGSYFEPKAANYDPAAPKYHVRVVNATNVRLQGGILQLIPGTAIYIDNSTDVLIDEVSSEKPIKPGGTWEYDWTVYGALGIYITASCRRIRLRNFTPVPIMFEDLASLDTSNRRKLSSTVDVLGGSGLFGDGGTGLPSGWVENNASGTATFSRVAAQSAPNPSALRIDSTADYQGARRPVTLEPNTDYTVVAFVQNDGPAYFGSSYAARFDGPGGASLNLQAMNRMRLVCVPFNSGATPPPNVGIWSRNAGRTVTVEGMRVLKGRFDVSTVPLD